RRGTLDDPVDAIGTLEESRDFTVASFRSALRWRPAERWLVHAGLEGQQQDGRFEVDITSRYGALGAALQPRETLLRRVSTARDGRILTAFLSAQHRPTDHLTVEFGGRFDVQDIDPVHESQFSPRVQISWDDGESW